MEEQGVLGALPRQVPAAESEPLARAARGGDKSAFEALVRQYQRRVFGLAYQYLQDADEAQDLAQEVFVRLYRHLRQYDPDRPFEPWFWRLAANVAASYRQRQWPAPALALREEAPAADLDAGQVPLELAVASLDQGLRLPVLLYYHADLPLGQVAAALGLSVPAVKSRLHRARAALRRLLAEDEPCPV
jgi:RNA polymerase sigma-70 factor, ECF subfamily